MSVVAELSVPSDQFALGTTLQAVPSVEVEFERSVTHSQGWIMPFLWVEGGDLDAFERAVVDDPTVAEARAVDHFDGVDLYMVAWADGIRETVNRIFDRSGILLEAAGDEDGWDLRVQFVDYASLTSLEEQFEQSGTEFRLDRLYTPETPRQTEYHLTTQQLEAIVVAAERGYFDVPRRATLSELAHELGISSTAVSERIRRGLYALVTDALSIDEPIEGEA